MSREIREALWGWSQAAVSVLSTYSTPQRIDWLLAVDDTGGSSGQGVPVPDVHALVHSASPILQDLPETSLALEATLKDTQAKAALITGIQEDRLVLQRSALFTNCLAPMAIQLLSSANTAITLKDRFSTVFRHLEDYIYRFEQLEYRWIIHLTGIRSELDSVELGENVRIRRASLKDQTRAFAASEGYASQPWARLSGVKPLPPRIGAHSVPLMVIEIRDQHRLPREQPFSEPARTVGLRVLESLQLAGEEAVAGHSIWREDPCIFARVDCEPQWFDHDRLKFLPYPHYVLTTERAQIVRRLFPLINLPPEPDRLSLARQRLSYSYDRRYIADPILECWIGLESLFLPEVSGELRLRAALRIAQYLGNSPTERHEIFGLAKKSYDARSALAHGNLGVIQKLDDALVTKTRDLLRRAIQKSLLDGHPPKVQQLDESLLD